MEFNFLITINLRNWISSFIEDSIWGDLFYLMSMMVLAGGLILVIKGVLKIIQKFVTSKTETDLDDQIITLIDSFFAQILIVTALYYSFDELKENLNEKVELIIKGLAFSIIVIMVCRLVSRLIDVFLKAYLEYTAKKRQTTVDQELMPLFERVIKILVYVTGIVVILRNFNIDLTGFAIGATAISFAVSFASQDTLSNMIAGFVIMVDRPFRVGDRIKLVSSNLIGDVIDIGLRSTKILGFDNHVVIIPNSEIAKSQLINLSYPDPQARVKVDFGVAYGTDIEKLKILLVGMAKNHPEVLHDPEPIARFIHFGESDLQMTLICRVQHFRDEFRIAEELRIHLQKLLAENGIEIPFPQRVIHMKNEN